MNRRGFFGTIGKVAAGFMILPGAGRVWKAVVDPKTIINPEWVAAPYEVRFMCAYDYAAFPLDGVLPVIHARREARIDGVLSGEAPYDPDELRKQTEARWPANVNFPEFSGK